MKENIIRRFIKQRNVILQEQTENQARKKLMLSTQSPVFIPTLAILFPFVGIQYQVPTWLPLEPAFPPPLRSKSIPVTQYPSVLSHTLVTDCPWGTLIWNGCPPFPPYFGVQQNLPLQISTNLKLIWSIYFPHLPDAPTRLNKLLLFIMPILKFPPYPPIGLVHIILIIMLGTCKDDIKSKPSIFLIISDCCSLAFTFYQQLLYNKLINSYSILIIMNRKQRKSSH